MRLLWLSHKAQLGGAELALAEGAAALAARGATVHVVLPRDGPLSQRLPSVAGVHVVPYNGWTVPTGAGWSDGLHGLAYDCMRARPALAELARRVAAEVVLSNTLTVAAGALAARQAGIPHAWFLHEFGREEHEVRLVLGRSLTLRRVDKWSRVVLVNSETLHDHFRCSIAPEKLRVVPYAVEVPAVVARASAGPLRLVAVGVRRPAKGQHDAVAAVGLLRARNIAVQLELIGDGDVEYDRDLRRMAGQLGVANDVIFTPFQPSPFEQVARADVALTCSRSEAFGRVTVEAMKLGKPVVGADSGATPELIRDGWNGLLYPAGDAEALAGRLEMLWSNPALRAKLGEQGRQFALARFNMENYGSALENALQDTAPPHPAGFRGSRESRAARLVDRVSERGETPRVSITVVAYNSADGLGACLQSVRGAVTSGLAEAIVVDNASPDASGRLVEQDFPEVRLVRSPVNQGFGGGCNLAWPLVRGSYWLLLNPDVVVPPEGVERLCAWMDLHPDVGAATPELVDRAGRSQHAARRFPSLWRSALELSRLHRLVPSRLRGRALLGAYRQFGGDELGADWVPAAALIVRRAVVEQVGLLRTDVVAYGEDVEWCWRIRRAGWRVAVCGGMPFVHEEGGSTVRTWGSEDRRRRMWSGLYWACACIRGRRYARGLIALTAAALAVEAHHPGRPPASRQRARRDLQTHIELLRRVDGGPPAVRPGAPA